jgi:FixJ family two-component response regulator
VTSVVAVIDDDDSVRQATSRLLMSAGYRVAPFESAERFIEQAGAVDADCLLLDVNMPGLGGMGLQQWLSDSGVRLPIVFITGFGDIPMTVRAMKRGAVDFLQKPVDDEQLLAVIETAVLRSRELRREREQLESVTGLLGSLTPREREVFGHIVLGKLNKQIANDLAISEKTVKVHRGRVMAKLEVRSVAELVRIAERAGIPAD